MDDAVDNIPYIYGSTNTADSLKVMREDIFNPARGDRPDAPNIAMILTDGVSNINSRRTISEAETSRDQVSNCIHVTVDRPVTGLYTNTIDLI